MFCACNSMNNLLSYCRLIDAKIRASDKDLPVLCECVFSLDQNRCVSNSCLPTENILHSFGNNPGVLVRCIDNARNVMFIMCSLKRLRQGSDGSVMSCQAGIEAHNGSILMTGVVKDL